MELNTRRPAPQNGQADRCCMAAQVDRQRLAASFARFQWPCWPPRLVRPLCASAPVPNGFRDLGRRPPLGSRCLSGARWFGEEADGTSPRPTRRPAPRRPKRGLRGQTAPAQFLTNSVLEIGQRPGRRSWTCALPQLPARLYDKHCLQSVQHAAQRFHREIGAAG